MMFFPAYWFLIVLINTVYCISLHKREYEEVPKEYLTTEKQLVNASDVLVDYKGLNLNYNTDKKLLGFSNQTDNVGFVFIVKNSNILKLLVDSKCGKILSYETTENVSIIENKDYIGDITEILTKITKCIYDDKDIPGESTKISPTSEEGLKLLSDVFLHLGHSKKPGSTEYKKLHFISSIAHKLSKLYYNDLNGLIEGKGPFPLKQNLNRFNTISSGLKELLTKAEGGFETINKKVKFDLKPLFNNKNGAEVFVYILRQTGEKFNLATLWGKLLNDIGRVLKIIQLLAGGENRNGVDDTFALLAKLYGALSLNVSVEDLIKFLFDECAQDAWTNSDDGDYTSLLKDIKHITDEQARKYDNTGLLQPFVTFFSNLTSNSIIKDGVNVSEIIEKWRKRDIVGGLKFVGDFILKWYGPTKYTDLLFNGYLSFLNTSYDPSGLKRIIPDIPIGNLKNGNSSLWNQISKTFDIDSQLKNNKDANEILKKVPAFSEFSKIHKDIFSKPFDFSKALSGQTITDYITKIFVGNPVKWTVDVSEHVVEDSGNFLKHIFWDPIFPHSKDIRLPSISPEILSKDKLEKIPKLDFLQSFLKPVESLVPILPKGVTTETIIKKDDETTQIKEETSEKPCDDCTNTEKTKVTKKNEECDDCKKTTTEKLEGTKKDGDCDDCNKTTEKPEVTKKDGDCDDCSKTTENEDSSVKKEPLETAEYKHHHGHARKADNKHHHHLKSKENHEVKHNRHNEKKHNEKKNEKKKLNKDKKEYKNHHKEFKKNNKDEKDHH